jgi:putative ABC transport system permease protein
MNLASSFRFALRGISANKLRSLLTTLGILIGVAAVIVLLAVGTGSSAAVKSRIAKLGTNTLTINRSAGGNGRAGTGTTTRGGAGGAAAAFGGGGGFAGAGARGRTATGSGNSSQSTSLTLEDAAAVGDPTADPDVADIAPVVTASSVTAGYTGVTHTVGTFIGSTPSYLSINNDTVQYGTSFTDNDYTTRAYVAVLGTTVAADLFGTPSSAVGKTVQFNGKNFTVTGVLTTKGSSGFTDQDDTVIAPLTAVQDEFTGVGQSLSSIVVQAKSAGDVTKAQNEIYAVLDSRHDVTATTRDYTVQNQAAILSTATSTTQTLTVLLGAVAAISLLVGGIGVMNIMLVTVTERTREIGIRKAIGAGRGDIVFQFIAEAVLLTIFGALMGVAVGLIGSQFKIVGVAPVITSWSVLLAFGVAVAIGLFFGIYPANRAARLRPIDALRYE